MESVTIVRDAETTPVKHRLMRSNNHHSVSFSPSVTVHQFQKVPDARAIWYNQDDYVKLKKQTEQSLQKLDEGKLVESCVECLVGLPSMSRHGRQTKRQRHDDAMQAVLREQRNQRKLGIVDASRVAEAYLDCCSDSNCKIEAAMSAMRLAVVVNKREEQNSTSSSFFSSSSQPTAPIVVATNKKALTLRGFLDRTGFRVSASRR
jgi:hypothetical protein